MSRFHESTIHNMDFISKFCEIWLQKNFQEKWLKEENTYDCRGLQTDILLYNIVTFIIVTSHGRHGV